MKAAEGRTPPSPGDDGVPYYDWIVIGSGFGGSVAALRLAEKGYRVAVLERGRRYQDEDFADSAWDLKRFLWAPALGLRGIFRMSVFKDVFIASGSGVGGGSLVWANTMYRAKPAFFTHPQWPDTADWSQALAPHYATAERMLGMQRVPHASDGQALLREMAEHFGVGETFTRTSCAVYFGAPGVTVPDPYFGWRRPGSDGLPEVRRVHGRLPDRRQEHAGEELPLVRRAARSRGDPRARGDRHPAGWRGGRVRGLRGRFPASRRLGAAARAELPCRRSRRVGGRPRHQRVARPLRAAGRSAPAQLSTRASGAHQQRIAACGDVARRLAQAVERCGDQCEFPPGPGHTHRIRHLRQACRRAVRADHATDRQRHATDAATEAASERSFVIRCSSCGRCGRFAGRAAHWSCW